MLYLDDTPLWLTFAISGTAALVVAFAVWLILVPRLKRQILNEMTQVPGQTVNFVCGDTGKF